MASESVSHVCVCVRHKNKALRATQPPRPYPSALLDSRVRLSKKSSFLYAGVTSSSTAREGRRWHKTRDGQPAQQQGPTPAGAAPTVVLHAALVKLGVGLLKVKVLVEGQLLLRSAKGGEENNGERGVDACVGVLFLCAKKRSCSRVHLRPAAAASASARRTASAAAAAAVAARVALAAPAHPRAAPGRCLGPAARAGHVRLRRRLLLLEARLLVLGRRAEAGDGLCEGEWLRNDTRRTGGREAEGRRGGTDLLAGRVGGRLLLGGDGLLRRRGCRLRRGRHRLLRLWGGGGCKWRS